MLMLMSHCGSLVAYAYAYACVASEDQALDIFNMRNKYTNTNKVYFLNLVPTGFKVRMD